MNPDAKEFVPAHILKKRQEEAEHLGELTKQLDGVNINSNSEGNPTTTENGETINGSSNDQITNNNSNDELHHDLDEEDDSYLLKAGENLCEFNGEQFIIPGDDDEQEEEHMPKPGYDFGNAEDNEDEDVCNAFEEFLENLPDQ